MRYRRKGATNIVEARLLTMSVGDELAEWCGGLLVQERNSEDGYTQPGINVPTPNGNVRASLGDWILEYEGQFYVKSAPQFRLDYEKVEDDDPRQIEGGSPEFRDLHSGMTGREALGFAPKPTTGFSD